MPVMAEDSVDDMIGTLWFVRIADTPIFNVLQIDESFLNAELALVRLILLIVAQQVIVGGHSSSHLRHAQADAIWSNVPRTKQNLMIILLKKVFTVVWCDSRHIKVHVGSLACNALSIEILIHHARLVIYRTRLHHLSLRSRVWVRLTRCHRMASHWLAPYRLAHHRLAHYRLAYHRLACHRLACHRLACHGLTWH